MSEQTTSSVPHPVAPGGAFLAPDLSRTGWAMALQTSGDARVSTHKLRAGDIERWAALFERVRAREEQRSGAHREMQFCYEAGYHGFWMHRHLRAIGVNNVVVEPTRLQVDRRERRIKPLRAGSTADELLHALIAHPRANRRVWLVGVPTTQQEANPVIKGS